MSSKIKTVCIIEDEEDVRFVLARGLKDAGYEVIKLDGGSEILPQILGSKPDCIIIDILLEGVNGLDILAEIRNDSWGRSVPVIVLTAIRHTELQVRAESLGVAAYLDKEDAQLSDVLDSVHTALTK